MKDMKIKCIWNLKSNTVFPSRSKECLLQSFNIKARSLLKNNRDSWICWYVKQDLEDCKRQLLQGRRALCTVSRHNLIRIMMPYISINLPSPQQEARMTDCNRKEFETINKPARSNCKSKRTNTVTSHYTPNSLFPWT